MADEPVKTDPPATDPAATDPVKTTPDVTPVVTEPTSQTATIPSTAAPATAPDDKKYSFFETIPAELKDKPYLKDVKDFDGLYKKLDGAQELIGKRASGIPADDAPTEEKEAFAKAWGRPEKADGYTAPEIKLPEGVTKDPELEKFAKEIFFEAGLNQNQVNIIQGKYEAKMLEAMQAQAADPAMSDDAFDKMTTDLFKDRTDTVLKNSQLLLKENLPEALQSKIEGLNNEALTVLAAVLDGVREKYISEDVMPREGEVPAGSDSVNELRQQARVLMAKPEYTNKSHKDHLGIAQEVKDVYDRIARIEARIKK